MIRTILGRFALSGNAMSSRRKTVEKVTSGKLCHPDRNLNAAGVFFLVIGSDPAKLAE
jgi:hypothetical protein